MKTGRCGFGVFAVALLLCGAGMAVAQPVSQPATLQQQMDAWWNDLKDEEPKAARALLNFSAHPDDAVAYFKDHVVPLKISTDDLTVLLIDLASDKESVWRQAFDQLEYFDPRLAMDLETVMQDVKDPPARTRLVAILSDRPPESTAGQTIELRKFGPNNDQFNFTNERGSWWAEARIDRLGTKKTWVRAERAIALLGHIGTPQAMAIVKDMASGHPDALPTKVAKEELALNHD